MARFNSYTPPEDEEELDKRKELALVLKKFARGDIKVDPEEMVKVGADIGISRGQLSNLYKQYKKEIGSELMAGPPEPAGQKPAGQEPAKQKSGFTTPNLDRLAQMQNEPIGSRPMGSERRIITSPEGQMRLMARKAARAGIDVGQLISSNRGDIAAAFGELDIAGLGAKGIRTQEEVRLRPELAKQLRAARADLLRRQEEEYRKAEEERIAKEEEEKRRKQEQQMPIGGDIWAV